jgi:Zn finger protein HypA/HybF involved in hydrogenase expression
VKVLTGPEANQQGTYVAEERHLEIDDNPQMSACDKCGAEYPSAPLGTIHKCGQCSGGYCKRKVVN